MSKILRIQEFAKLVGRTPQTIRRWEKEGKLVAKRLPSGHRYFLESDVQIVRDIPFSSETCRQENRRLLSSQQCFPKEGPGLSSSVHGNFLLGCRDCR